MLELTVSDRNVTSIDYLVQWILESDGGSVYGGRHI